MLQKITFKNEEVIQVIDYSSKLKSTEETFLKYVQNTDQTNKKCQSCYEEFKVIVDEIHILDYKSFIVQKVNFYLKTSIKEGRQYPDILVKCKICACICCMKCINEWSKQDDEVSCPLRCRKIFKKNETSNYPTVWYPAVQKSNNDAEMDSDDEYQAKVGCASFLLENIKYKLNHEKKREIIVDPLSIKKINDTRIQTLEQIDKIYFDIKTQQIRGCIKDLYSDDFILLQYPVNIVCGKNFTVDKKQFDQDKIQEILISAFKEDITNLYDTLQKPTLVYKDTRMSLMSLGIELGMELGIIKFIQKYSFDYACDERFRDISKDYRTNKLLGHNKPQQCFDIQRRSVRNKYVKLGAQIHYAICLMDQTLKVNSKLKRVLQPEEFIDFFTE